MAVQSQIEYYYKQDTNQILAGNNANIVTVGEMNALLTSSKTATPLTNINTVAKIKSIGQAISYRSDVVYNSASAGFGVGGFEGVSIPIASNQELWVYRGIQPPNTTPNNTPTNAGPGDSNHTQYNAYLHRPYKLYMLTETGSGVGTEPWLPFGNFFNNGTGNSNSPAPNNVFNRRQLSIVGNLDNSGLSAGNISQSIASGSFEMLGGAKESHPWVFTNYGQLGSPPVVGSSWNIFIEDTAVDGKFQLETFPELWDSSIGGAPSGTNSVNANNANASLVTNINVSRNGSTLGTTSAILGVSSSGHFGKPMGQVKLTEVGFSGASAFYTITQVNNVPSNYWSLTVSTPVITGTWPPANNASISMSFSGPQLITSIAQVQNATFNTQPNYSTTKLKNGFYTYTSSAFDTESPDGTGASGSSQFGLFSDLDNYVEYKATVASNNVGDVKVTYTGSTGVPLFSNISPGFNSTFTASPGTVSASNDTAQTFTLELVANSAFGTPPVDIYSTRINDVYLSLSSSLTNSIDGLYIFNQLPSDDIYVTASMLLNAWTGSDVGAKYGDSTSLYAISPATPVYGEGEAGDGTTWPTASINIYKGNYPANVPNETASPLHTQEYITQFGDYGNNGIAITTSFVLPSESISFQDCLSLSLSVTSGSNLASIVQNSLIVSEYTLEFNNASSQENGDGRVPTFIDNSYKGTDGFSNAPDCQPLLNNVVQERNNPYIQIVDYPNSPYDPSNFQQILSGSAEKSTVPVSNYDTVGWVNSRYEGSQTSAYRVNSIDGLINGFGKSPVIDYKRAYLGYADQVTDPYPVVNNKTQVNILYLINAGGDALNPLISEYTAYDVLGTWDEGGLGTIGINQISGSTQFDALNGVQTTFKVGKQAIPLLYSQVGAKEFAQAIPIAGNSEQVSTITSSFIEYDMSSQGSSTSTQQLDTKNAKYFNVAQGIGNQSVALFPQDPGTFDGTNFTISSGSGFGIQRASPDVAGVIELPIITASIGSYTAPTNVFGTEYFGNPGEVFFTTDPLGSGSVDLSDDYMVRGTFSLPATYPSRYKTKKYVKKSNKKKTTWNNSNIGNLSFSFESTTSDVLDLGESNWTQEPFSWLDDASPNGYQDPTMTFYMGNIDGTPNGTEIVASFNALSSQTGFNSQKTIYTHQIEADDVLNWLTNNGHTPSDVQFVTYDMAFQSNTTLQSGTRYRFRCFGELVDEPIGQTGNSLVNVFNPTNLPDEGDGATGGSPSSRIPYTSNIPSKGPYVSMNVVGDQIASSLSSNALNFPYWDFASGSNNIGQNGFEYGIDNQSTPFSQTSNVQAPDANSIYFNNASGSLRTAPNNSNTWIGSVATLPTCTQAGVYYAFGFQGLTSGLGQLNGQTFKFRSTNGSTFQEATLIYNGGNAGNGGFIPGDTITFTKATLEFYGFGTVSGDIVFTLTDDYTNNNQIGSSIITIAKTAKFNQSIASILTNIATIGNSNDQGKIQIVEKGVPNHFFTGSIQSLDNTNATYAIITVGGSSTLANGGNVSSYNNPFNNVSDELIVEFTTGSAAGGGSGGTGGFNTTEIELQSPNGNNNYGLGYYQGYLPYTASANNNFPGGVEPQDTAWPLPNVPYVFKINDEIRFENDEKKAYKIVNILSPKQNFIINQINKLRLTVAPLREGQQGIAPSTNLNFFLIRRYVDAPNSVIVNRVFPYGSLPTVKEFVSSDNNILTYNDGSGPSTGANATGSTSIMETSGSFIEYIKPLLKSDNTPSGIILPEFPIDALATSPDEVIRDLRDKKLID